MVMCFSAKVHSCVAAETGSASDRTLLLLSEWHWHCQSAWIRTLLVCLL